MSIRKRRSTFERIDASWSDGRLSYRVRARGGGWGRGHAGRSAIVQCRGPWCGCCTYHILHAVQRDRLHRHALEQAARWFLLLARGGRERSLDVNLHGLALNSLDSGDVAADTLEDGLNVGLGRVRDPAQAACRAEFERWKSVRGRARAPSHDMSLGDTCVGVRPVGGVVHIGCWYETEW